MKLFVVVICAALLASVSAQGDMFNTMMIMRLLGGGGGGGGGGGSSLGGLSGLGLGQSGSSTRSPAANRLLSSSRSSGLGSLLGGGRMGMNPLLMMHGSDRMRDMMLCNYMPTSMRAFCMTRAFQ